MRPWAVSAVAAGTVGPTGPQGALTGSMVVPTRATAAALVIFTNDHEKECVKFHFQD